MVLLELSIVPMDAGDSVSQQVADCVALIARSGLAYELHSMGTIIEGELADVLAVMQQCIEHVASGSSRVTCSAKLDYRPGHSGRLRSKVETVREILAKSP